MAFVIDGRVVSAPRIMAPITGIMAVVEGDMTEDEARKIAMQMARR